MSTTLEEIYINFATQKDYSAPKKIKTIVEIFTKEKMKNILIFLNLVVLVVAVAASTMVSFQKSDLPNLPGVVVLDLLTFNKTVKKFPFAFVMVGDGTGMKLDSAKRSEFGKLSSEYLSQSPDMLAAEVRLTFGEAETRRLAARFQIQDNLALPEFILFSVDQKRSSLGWSLVANETRYGGDVRVKKMLEFLKGEL